MRAYAPHKRAVVQPGRFNLRDFLRKKTNFELAAMLYLCCVFVFVYLCISCAAIILRISYL